MNIAHHHSWKQSLRAFLKPQVMTMLFLGFSAGIPILLIFSSLGLWLREAGVERSVVTYFSWAALGYSFKFVWAPLVDKLPIPFLTRWLGRRRAWILLSQIMIMVAIGLMASIDPATGALTAMAGGAVLLGFSSATQDIVIDAYRIESAESDLQAFMSSTYIVGYRIGMLVAGAGALYLADYLGTSKESYLYDAWKWTYLVIASVMLIGVMTTLIISEPDTQGKDNFPYSPLDYLRFVGLFILAVLGFILSFYYSSDLAQTLKNNLMVMGVNANFLGFLVEFCRLLLAIMIASIIAILLVSMGFVKKEMAVQSYIAPVQDFFQRYGWSLALLLLALIGLYRISDIVLGVISNVFYQDMGFNKTEIASVGLVFGVIMTIIGSFLGGLLTFRFGVMKILFLGALLSALTNLLFMLLAQAGHDIVMLYIVIAADNLSGGLAVAAFIAFLSSLINVSFTAMQYAIFSSLMTLLPKILGGYSGTMVDTMGYSNFFLITALMGVPVLILIIWAGKHFELNKVVIK